MTKKLLYTYMLYNLTVSTCYYLVICSIVFYFSFYLSEGFIHLQSIVGEAIIRLMANPDMNNCDGALEHNISVAMRQLPYPQYTVDFFLITAVSILPFLIVLAFIYSAGTFTKVIIGPLTFLY